MLLVAEILLFRLFKRWLLDGGILLLLLLCLTTIAEGIRTSADYVVDTIVVSDGSRCEIVLSFIPGHLCLLGFRTPMSKNCDYDFPARLHIESFSARGVQDSLQRSHYDWWVVQPTRSVLGFSWNNHTLLPQFQPPGFNAHVFSIPLWFLAGAFSIAPTARFLYLSRKHKRRRRSLCIHCGYDLRASIHKCPECGSPIPVPKEMQQRKMQ
jgi:hypothetical protein